MKRPPNAPASVRTKAATTQDDVGDVCRACLESTTATNTAPASRVNGRTHTHTIACRPASHRVHVSSPARVAANTPTPSAPWTRRVSSSQPRAASALAPSPVQLAAWSSTICVVHHSIVLPSPRGTLLVLPQQASFGLLRKLVASPVLTRAIPPVTNPQHGRGLLAQSCRQPQTSGARGMSLCC
ncbi:hypothetical protein JDV02_002300 [Purpureocillium takamizusanense]|uniref:Uncharacterized protein n=1 Tax=Purpureocillium takamizusanense TaxID=2060973 RepID=A0A9Q8V7B0_9HYPO|nr:uncharacterized protein JDV02_002300 [Purpureocillium takamizusanense]UNI15800.1 hypothetical protein JDV02_002300 [Purpureocillium takamizusanense]